MGASPRDSQTSPSLLGIPILLPGGVAALKMSCVIRHLAGAWSYVSDDKENRKMTTNDAQECYVSRTNTPKIRYLAEYPS